MKKWAVFMFCMVPIATVWCVVFPVTAIVRVICIGVQSGWNSGEHFVLWVRENV